MYKLPFLSSLLRTFAIGAIGLAALTSSVRSADRITLATSGLNDGQLPYFVAAANKLFEKEGIETERLEFKSGGAAIQAFASGSADFCICAADHVIRLNNRGIKARILVGLDAHFPNALVTLADSPITSLRDLKGKKIGITSPGSSTDNMIRWQIAKEGLNADRDFELVSVGSGIPMLAGLKSGSIDAGIVGNGEIINSETGASDPLKILIDWRELEDAALVIIGRQEWVDKNPDLARRFVRAQKEASLLIQRDPKAATLGMKEIYATRPDDYIRKVVESTSRRLSKDGSISSAGFETMTDIVVTSDKTTAPIPQSEVDLFPHLSQP